jgi:N utilization substance protein B
LFAYTFHQDQEFLTNRAKKIVSMMAEIDSIIEKCAPEWPLSQINRLDLAVLRQAIYELSQKKNTPPKVIIDEAIEIGKRYGSTSSGSFINGVLASALYQTKRNQDIDKQDEKESKEKEAQASSEKDSNQKQLNEQSE